MSKRKVAIIAYEKVKKLQVIDGFLQKASGYQFYNRLLPV